MLHFNITLRYMPNKLNVKHINGGQLKSRYSLHLILSLFLFVFIISCKEEAIVEQKNENKTAQSILAKRSDVSSVQGDLTTQQIKKERVKRLKKEHEKPYMVIDKPEKILAEILNARSRNRTLLKSSNNSNSYSVQSSQSCYTLEIDVWVFTKYEARAGKEFGIWPHVSRMYAGSSGDPDRIRKLNELKSKWGFNYIAASIGSGANIGAIVNAGYPRQTNYMAMVNANTSGYDAVRNCCNGLSPSDYFWAYYTDEPSSEQNVTEWELFTLDTLVKNQHPNSLFGFGETWLGAVYKYTNTYYRTIPNFVMCTKYLMMN